MIGEVDPDLWLFTRLMLGPRWRVAIIIPIVMGLSILVGEWPNRGVAYFWFADTKQIAGSYPMLWLSVVIAMAGASWPIAALTALERDDQIDTLRLSGRTAYRPLLAAVASLAAPFVVLAGALLIVNAAVFHLPARFAWHVLLLAGAALDVALMLYPWLPPGTGPITVFGAFALASVMSVPLLGGWGWFNSSRPIAAAAVAATLPVAIALACRRFVRPAANRRARLSLFRLSRWTPRQGPPEAWRELRSSVTAAAWIGAALEIAVLWLVWMARHRVFPGSAETYLLSAWTAVVGAGIVGALAPLAVMGQEIERGTMDLVRLTPQTPEAIATSWYIGLAAPYWAIALMLWLTLAAGVPREWLARFEPPPGLIAAVLVAPAVMLPEGMRGRGRGVVFITTLAALIFALGPYMDLRHIEEVRAHPNAGYAGPSPWQLNVPAMLPFLALAAGLGAASGRLRRPDGPMLAGFAAVGAVAAVALASRMAPWPAYPRFVAGALPLLAAFLARDGAATPPWTRLIFTMSAAVVAVSILCLEGGLTAGQSVTSGFCAALTLGIALLGFERLGKRPALAHLLVAGVVLCAMRFPVEFVTMTSRPHVPVLFDAMDVTWLVAAFIAFALAHRWRPAARVQVMQP